MELIKSRYKIRCEVGGCRNISEYTIKTARIGIRAHMHICTPCMGELYGLLSKEIIPKPIENPLGGRRNGSRLSKS